MMLTKCLFVLVAVCLAETMAGLLGVGGANPPLLGGVSECLTVEEYPRELTDFAIQEMAKNEYSVERIGCVTSQIVSGVMYEMELHVSKTCKTTFVRRCHTCNLRVLFVPWGQGPEYSLDANPVCRERMC